MTNVSYPTHPAITERTANRRAPLDRADFAFAERIDGRSVGIEPDTDCSENVEDAFAGGERTLVELDTGTYRIESPVVIRGTESVGIVAKPGSEVTFEVPAEYDGPLVRITDCENALLAGFGVDQRASGAHPKLAVGVSDRFLIEDVEVRGIGDATASGSRMPLRVERENGIGVLRRVRAAEGSAFPPGRSGENRRAATWIGPDSKGTIWYEDCHFEEHNAHAIYASAAPGPVKVLRGVYKNNDNSQIRFCGPGCEIDGALVELDTDRCAHTDAEGYRRTRGVFNEQKKHPRTGGLVRDTTIRVLSHPKPAGGYVAYGTGGGMRITGCEFEIDVDDCPAITVDAPDEHWGHPRAPKPRRIAVTDSRIHGMARSGTAIRIDGRPGSRVERCCIAGRGERQGVRIAAGAVRETTFDLDDTGVLAAEERDGLRTGSCAEFFAAGGAGEGNSGVANGDNSDVRH